MLPPKRSTRSSLGSLFPAMKQTAENSDNCSPSSINDALNSTEDNLSSGEAHTGVYVADTSDLRMQMSPIENIPRKSRRKLTVEQQSLLEKAASLDKYPDLEKRRELATQLGLKLKAVSVWFQNKRRPSTKPSATDMSTRPRPQFKRFKNVDSKTLRKSPASVTSRGFSSPLWSLLPSSPDSGFSSGQIDGSTGEALSKSKALPPISLEWACDKDRANHASNRMNSGIKDLPQRKASTLRRSRQKIRDFIPPFPTLRPSMSTKLYSPDELEVAITLVQMKQQCFSAIII